MPQVTITKGLESVTVNATTVNEAVNSALGQALGIPDNPEYIIDGNTVDGSALVNDGETIVVQQKAATKA